MTHTPSASLSLNSQFNSRKHHDFGPQRDALIPLDTLFNLIESQIGMDKFDKGILSGLIDKLSKDKDNRFAIQEFFSVGNEYLGMVRKKIDFSCAQLSKMLWKKQQIEKNSQEARNSETQLGSAELYEGLLRVKVWEVRDLIIETGEKVYMRISCDDLVFNTRIHDYLTSTFEEAFYEFFIKTGLEKLKVQIVVSSKRDLVLGEFEILIRDSKLEMEQDEWYMLTSVKDGKSVCGEVRLSLKLVPLKGNLLQSSTEEIEDKIQLHAQEVEKLEKVYKNLNMIMTLMKNCNGGNSNTTYDVNNDKHSVQSSLFDRRPSFENEVQGLDGSGRKSLFKEKKRALPPLGLQKLEVVKVGESAEANKEVQLKNIKQYTSPVKAEINPRNYSSAPKPEESDQTSRNSIMNLLDFLTNPVREFSVNSNQPKSASMVRSNDSNEVEVDQKIDSNNNLSIGSNDKTNWKKENLKLNGMVRNLQEENKVLLKEIQRLKNTDQKVKECRDKMTVLIGELNRVQGIVKEKDEEVAYWKKQSEKNSSVDIQEVQGKIQKLVDENQRLRDIALKAHNESMYYKNQCESYGEGRSKVDSLLKEIEILRTVNQNLNQEQIEKDEMIKRLRKENCSMKQNNMTFSNELAKRDSMLDRLKTELSSSTMVTRSGMKENKTIGSQNKMDFKKNQYYLPLQPWNFLNTE